ncbi:MAG: helix-turn-helix transcriptional regulator [Gemmataceae bacterium]|nr:helix-turn-helix transcriptional regulator [Gemmataceae bacterium]
MTFAEKLRELRDDRGLSEAKLAEASGLPVATVHNYSLGRRKPSFAAVVKLARALGVDCTAFADCDDVQGEEEPPPAKSSAKPPPRPRGKGKAT